MTATVEPGSAAAPIPAMPVDTATLTDAAMPVSLVGRTIAVVGLGAAGLAAALGLADRGATVLGVEVRRARRDALWRGEVDPAVVDRARLAGHLAAQGLVLTGDLSAVASADAVLTCDPAPGAERGLADAHCADLIPVQTTAGSGAPVDRVRDLLARPLRGARILVLASSGGAGATLPRELAAAGAWVARTSHSRNQTWDLVIAATP